MSSGALPARPTLLEPTRLVRVYVLALGGGLLLEGGALLLVNAMALPLPVGTNDTRHNLLHVVWGIGLLAIAATRPGPGSTRVAWASLVFGVFYIALGVLGVLIDRPFGLLLGPGENIFHFVVGPIALLLGARALRRANWR
ncbi:MAG TPA: hypothetical protein VKV73_23650 [Chloroflexota bacterium]|nr:hypothetical protein [Chloroflexota bacterium]